jgi:hydrogenase maturation protein HypF
VRELIATVRNDAPQLANVSAVTTTSVPPSGDADFSIVASRAGGSLTASISPDTATCADCVAEVFDRSNRRYRYPFTNCTNCGPRFTIVRAVPYDRAATTMAGFAMCPQCQAEYADPSNRRFHAQPNACPVCGPQLRWNDRRGDDALVGACDALRAGAIVAVKGIGGFHLAVDATNAVAVGELRRRKHRDDKPFAVMVADVASAHALCELDAAAVAALCSTARPVVLAPRRDDAPIAAGVAPGVADLGVILPYTPLHHLLLADLARPLVMTSGNLSDDPIAYDDADAAARLAGLVDGILGHDRPIHIRCDDSVVRSDAASETTVLRRARGYAPSPLALPVSADRTILAVGGELKNTVAITVGDSVVASHHLGDLEHLAAYQSFVHTIDHLGQLFGVRPDVIAHDLHPEYLSTKYARDLDAPLVAVQHHHAHVAACLVDHGRSERVLALAFDGLGYGPDATLWGGEFLVADLRESRRVGSLAPITLPGGAAAIREPWRMAVAWAERAGVAHGQRDDRAHAVTDLAQRGAGPTTTSMGRLFDAVAALLGVRSAVSFEGQAAMELEALARRATPAAAELPITIERVDEALVLDPAPLVAALVRAATGGSDKAALAAAFHVAVGRAASDAALALASEHDLATVVLTGGVFQNVLLTRHVATSLRAGGLEVLTHRRVPPNDGGLSVGQAAVAAAQLAEPL